MKKLYVIVVTFVVLSMSILLIEYVDNTSRRTRDRYMREGREAGESGIPVEACPYGSSALGPSIAHGEWLKGWQEGYKNRLHHKEK